MSKRVEVQAVRFANWILMHFTSDAYQRGLARLITLGKIKALELRIQADARDSKMASEPGWDPVNNVMLEKNPNPEN